MNTPMPRLDASRTAARSGPGRGFLVLLALLPLAACGASRPDAWSKVPKAPAHTDHATFYEGMTFKTGPEVTRACLECHKDAAHDVMKTAHWKWAGEPVQVPGHAEKIAIGKKNLMNNFCISIQSNWAACTVCHAGYGWKDKSFDFKDENLVDCLVCHDQTGTYVKASGKAGLPDVSVDLMAVAKSVGRPNRLNCGVCHFRGGGGNAVKHGDMDDSLLHPSERLDVHMGGNGFVCVDCHAGQKHQIPGRSISVSVDGRNHLLCQKCHGDAPHADERINAHADTLACQTCHIPYFAVDEGTKIYWDWSKAGDKELEKKIDNPHEYLAIKGKFRYGEKVVPEYAWYNGTADHYLIGDKMDPATETVLAGPRGDIHDPKARIWPFKVHRGKQPFDEINRTFLVPNTYGPAGFWTTFDWASALENGTEVAGQAYSGKFGFAPTRMYWPLSHMVAPANKALQCERCHSEGGRFDWKALGYDGDPMKFGGRSETGKMVPEKVSRR